MALIDEILGTIRRRPLAERLRLIQQSRREAADDTSKPLAVTDERRRALSVDEFLAARLTPPPGAGTVSLPDMETAIAQGANHV